MSQLPPNQNPYSASPNSPTPQTVDDGSLTAVDWVICVLCSGIGCIIGIVRLIQGKKSGGKMIAISIAFAVLWTIIRAGITVALQQK